MKNRYSIIFIALLTLALLLSGCTCSHEYGEWKTTLSSTCIAEGIETRACLACGEEETRLLPIAAHVYGDWKISTPATCTEAGSEMRECTVCGKKDEIATELAPHTFGKAKTLTAATCTETGIAEHSCVSCGYTENIATDKAAHSWNAATCLKPKTCKICAQTSGTPCRIQFVNYIPNRPVCIEINESTLVVVDDGDGTFTVKMEFKYLGSLKTNLCTMDYYGINDTYLGASRGSFKYLDWDNNYCYFQHGGIPADTVKICFTTFAY